MTLEQSLRDLLVKHDLDHFAICTDFNGCFYAFAQWFEGETREGVVGDNFATIAEALTDAIAKANAKRGIANEQRSITHVVLPDSPLCVEVLS